jgi:hypothetical protein
MKLSFTELENIDLCEEAAAYRGFQFGAGVTVRREMCVDLKLLCNTGAEK